MKKTRKTKWFKIYNDLQTFDSRRMATNSEEDWDKTIKKWRLIIQGLIPNSDTDACGLCDGYFDLGCIECPIYADTGRISCGGTPYEEWRFTKLLVTARRELEYLLSLKEKGGSLK